MSKLIAPGVHATVDPVYNELAASGADVVIPAHRGYVFPLNT